MLRIEIVRLTEIKILVEEYFQGFNKTCCPTRYSFHYSNLYEIKHMLKKMMKK